MNTSNSDRSTFIPPPPISSLPILPPPPPSPPSEPPLPMQTSNQWSPDGLDIGHGGGGNSCTSEKECSKNLKRKCSSIDSCFDDEPSPKTSVRLLNETFYSSVENAEEMNELDLTENEEHSNKLEMEFDILDEIEANGLDDEINLSNTDSESDILDEEIEAMLEEGLKSHKDSSTDGNGDDELAHEKKEKVILKVRGRDHFDVLPEGWIEVTHNSGMPIYLHKQSRVCTLSKPYFLGPGSARKHEVPVSAIPCLHYKKEIEKEKMSNVTDESQDSIDINKDSSSIPSAKLESVQDSRKSGSLDYIAVRNYCQQLFEFQTITVRRFKTWSGRRKHQKLMKQRQRPSLPEGTKLITCPLPPAPEKGQTPGNNSKREFIMNPSGKSFVCILHEYVQHTMRVQPRYIFKELENASTPYGAVVVINNMEYGSGYGSSKKQAKSEAAKATLEILIPQMKTVTNEGRSNEDQFQDVAFFDEVRVQDPRVCELCVKAGQPSPYQILLECLKRNYGMGDTQISFEMRNLKHQKNEFTMTVGKHSATVICKNKRDGKQRASQAILQLLHPHITSWGSLLRLYGKGSCKTLKEKKEEEQRITELQSKACANRPNMSILKKLKDEMLKYREKKEAVKPIGKLIPQEMELLSTSDSNLKNVEL